MSSRITARSLKRQGVFALFISATLLAPTDALTAEPSWSDLSQTIQGSIVCQGKDGVYVTPIGKEKGKLIAKNGTYPRWSPDGKKIAFVREKEIVISDADGKNPETVARANNPRAIAFHPSGNELFFTDGNNVKSADLISKSVTVRLKGETVRELDITPDGKFLGATIKGFAGLSFTAVVFNLTTGEKVFSTKGCGPSFSPDGKLFTVLGGDHTSIDLFDWQSGKKARSVSSMNGEKIDNPFWSNNPKFIASIGEDIKGAVISNIDEKTIYRVVAPGTCVRVDLQLHN